MPLLYESYVRTIDPARRTPVIPRVEEVGRRKLSPGPSWGSFFVGLGLGFVIFTRLGRDMVMHAAGLTEEEVRRRIGERKRRMRIV